MGFRSDFKKFCYSHLVDMGFIKVINEYGTDFEKRKGNFICRVTYCDNTYYANFIFSVRHVPFSNLVSKLTGVEHDSERILDIHSNQAFPDTRLVDSKDKFIGSFYSLDYLNGYKPMEEAKYEFKRLLNDFAEPWFIRNSSFKSIRDIFRTEDINLLPHYNTVYSHGGMNHLDTFGGFIDYIDDIIISALLGDEELSFQEIYDLHYKESNEKFWNEIDDDFDEDDDLDEEEPDIQLLIDRLQSIPESKWVEYRNLVGLGD